MPEFSDLRHCQGAFAEGREDELLEPHEPGDRSELAKGLLFKDLASVRKWLQEYSMKRKRSFRVVHSYVNRRYTVVCEKDDCNWRVCARKQKLTGKFKITKVVGPHTCAENELSTADLDPHSQQVVPHIEGSAEFVGSNDYKLC